MSEKFELTMDVSGSPLYNPDIAPTPLEKRTWNRWHIAALWVGMSVCIPTYMLGAFLMGMGMTWWQAVVTITLGNLIVLVPMALNAHAGTKYGIPFPVFLRAPFGTYGSNVPALMRAAVACGWFGIQTWIGGKAMYQLVAVLAPGITSPGPLPFIGINVWQLFFFFVFWAINLYFIVKGTESIKRLETWSAPILIAIGLALLAWGIQAGGGLGRVLRHSENFGNRTLTAFKTPDGTQVIIWLSGVKVDGDTRFTGYRTAFSKSGLKDEVWTELFPLTGDALDISRPLPPGVDTVYVEVRNAQGSTVVSQGIASELRGGQGNLGTLFFPLLTAMVGFWATLALNIPDFTRFARSQKDQILGQVIGLPTTMGLYSFIGIATTCAALVAFPHILVTEQAPWNPVDLLANFKSPALVITSMFFLMIATLTTNIAANVVSPANDFSNLAPKRISFRTGGIITAVLGVLMMPWVLWETPDLAIQTWLIGYSALLGPIAGIMIADYYVVRRTRLDLGELYRPQSLYGAFNGVSMAILLVSILPSVPGFLASVGLAKAGPFFGTLFTYAWFVGFALAFTLYCAYGLVWKRTRTS